MPKEATQHKRISLVITLLLFSMATNVYSSDFFGDDDYQRQQSQADRAFDEFDQIGDEDAVWDKPTPKQAAPVPEKVIIIKEIHHAAPVQAAPAPPVIKQQPAAINASHTTEIGSGVAFEFQSCIKTGSDMACHFNVTSQFFDRKIIFNHRHVVYLFDNVGNEYKFYKVKVGNQEKLSGYTFQPALVADTTTLATFFFSNISTQAQSIAKLEINSSANKSGTWESFTLKFRKLPFIER